MLCQIHHFLNKNRNLLGLPISIVSLVYIACALTVSTTTSMLYIKYSFMLGSNLMSYLFNILVFYLASLTSAILYKITDTYASQLYYRVTKIVPLIHSLHRAVTWVFMLCGFSYALYGVEKYSPFAYKYGTYVDFLISFILVVSIIRVILFVNTDILKKSN